MACGFKSRLGYQLRLLSSMKENPLLGIFFCLLKISHIFHRFPIIYAKRNQQICRMCDLNFVVIHMFRTHKTEFQITRGSVFLFLDFT